MRLSWKKPGDRQRLINRRFNVIKAYPDLVSPMHRFRQYAQLAMTGYVPERYSYRLDKSREAVKKKIIMKRPSRSSPFFNIFKMPPIIFNR